jgi:hypothetical protein
VPVVAREVKLVREANLAAAEPSSAAAVSRLISDLKSLKKNSRLPGAVR